MFMIRLRGGGALLAYIWTHPWALALTVVLLVLGAAAWVYQQIQEQQAGDKLRESERKDSIWNDK